MVRDELWAEVKDGGRLTWHENKGNEKPSGFYPNPAAPRPMETVTVGPFAPDRIAILLQRQDFIGDSGAPPEQLAGLIVEKIGFAPDQDFDEHASEVEAATDKLAKLARRPAYPGMVDGAGLRVALACHHPAAESRQTRRLRMPRMARNPKIVVIEIIDENR
jgi:hypothetical protein